MKHAFNPKWEVDVATTPLQKPFVPEVDRTINQCGAKSSGCLIRKRLEVTGVDFSVSAVEGTHLSKHMGGVN